MDVRVGIRGNVGVGVGFGLDVYVGLALGLSDGVAVTVVVGFGVDPGVAEAGSTVYRSEAEWAVYRSEAEWELAPLLLPKDADKHTACSPALACFRC